VAVVRIGVLGTGAVGNTLATKLVELGHEVRMGSRDAANDKAVAWAEEAGERASYGAFADAAEFGELVLNCTAGAASLDALEQAGEDALRGKVLIDVANPLDSSRGMPPTLTVANDDSLAEQIQRRFPETRVIKAFNTMNHLLMVDPSRVPDEHDLFMCGDDDGAKAQVRELAESFGWPSERIVDLGGIDGARAQEMYLPLWVRLFMAFGTGDLNIRVVR
jgi:8-hydroxy-5-deazaflavin:NADPH oxidoreductase